jgi:hypothetical protein
MSQRFEVTLRLTVSQSVCLGIEHLCGTCDQILLPVRNLRSFFLWGLQFAVWSLSGPSRAEPITILYCLIWDSPQPGGPGSRIYIPQEQGGPDSGFPICLLRLTGLQRRYSNPPRIYISVFTSSIYVTYVLQFSNLYTIYTKLLSVLAWYSRLCFRNRMVQSKVRLRPTVNQSVCIGT